MVTGSRILFFATMALALVSCSNSETQNGSLSCSATGTVVSGTATTAGAAVQVSNLSLSILNGTGPYSISLAGVTAATTALSSYTFPTTVTLIADGTGGFQSNLAITDTSTAKSATCYVYGGDTGTTSGLTLTATPATTVNVGASITLTATSTTTLSTVTFTGATSGVTLTQTGNVAVVKSTVPATVVITATSGSATQSILLTWGASTMTCTLHRTTGCTDSSCYYYVNEPVYYEIQSSTGEPVEVTYWYPGETWTTQPSYPIAGSSFGITYGASGQKQVYIVARSSSRTDIQCNGGAAMTDTLYVNPARY